MDEALNKTKSPPEIPSSSLLRASAAASSLAGSRELFSPFTGFNAFLRRALDILASALGLACLSPLFLLIAIAIRRESPGPALYRGRRAGQGGRPFHILKFRTMYEDPRTYAGPHLTAHADERITPLGRWLRHTKLNELPQLWNVLKGEMSLVGPRPEDFDIAQHWPAEARQEILAVRPGITSPASVMYHDEEQRLDPARVLDDYLGAVLPSKLRLDALYIRHRTILTDLDVIFWTFVILLPRLRGAQIPEGRLLWGPLSVFVTRTLSWFAVDSLVALTAVSAAGVLWRLAGPLDLGLGLAILIALVNALAFSLCNAAFGLNDISWARAPAGEVVKLAFSSALAAAMAVVANHLLIPTPLPDRLLLFAGSLAFTGFVVVRYRERLVTSFASRWISLRSSAASLGERVLVVGAGENAALATWLFTHGRFARAYSMAGFVDDDPRKFKLKIDGVRVIGATRDIPALVKSLDIGLIVFTIENITDCECQRILDLCRQTPARLALLPDTFRFICDQLESTPSAAFLRPADPMSLRGTKQSLFSADQAALWLASLQQVAAARDWESVETQLSRMSAELSRPEGESLK